VARRVVADRTVDIAGHGIEASRGIVGVGYHHVGIGDSGRPPQVVVAVR
jgi:hypothetical protein